MKKLVVVCGIPRTGTSVVAGIVNILGFQFDPGVTSPSTPTGSFMDPLVKELDKPHIAKQFVKKYARRTWWGIKIHGLKEPEKILFKQLPVWKVIHTTRSRDDAIRSLKEKRIRRGAKKKFAIESAIRRYECCRVRVDLALQGWDYVTVAFESLFENPRLEVLRIATFLDCNADEKSIEKAISFVNPEFRHYGRS